MSYGNGQHPGPIHKTPPSRRDIINAGSGSKGSGGSNGTQEPTKNINSTELTTAVFDPVFSFPDPADSSKRINTRRTTGRNTPSTVDAVFNFRNFWDGRAQNVCNGNNPFGSRDGQAHLMVTDETGNELGPVLVNMQKSALCSQSLGPILSSTEMSADDRNFHQVGKKLLARKPLAKQFVDPTDSVLGFSLILRTRLEDELRRSDPEGLSS